MDEIAVPLLMHLSTMRSEFEGLPEAGYKTVILGPSRYQIKVECYRDGVIHTYEGELCEATRTQRNATDRERELAERLHEAHADSTQEEHREQLHPHDRDPEPRHR